LLLAWHHLAYLLAIPYPWIAATLGAFAAMLPIRGRLQLLRWDQPRRWWQRILIDELYYIHWCAALAAALPIALVTLVSLGQRWSESSRRIPLGSTALAIYLSFFTCTFYGIAVRRRWLRVRRIDIAMPGLPAAFEGFRIAHLSDLHIGSQTPRSTGLRWSRRVNALQPDLAVVTGDMVTSGTAFHADIAAVLQHIQVPNGVVVSMGNHDYFGEGEPLVDALRAAGLQVLRNTSITLEKNAQKLRIAAVDDTWTKRADLEATLAHGPRDASTVLLAHDPSLFPRAAELGADLVLSGHTHGGQVAVPFLARRFNLARLSYQYTYGIYTHAKSTLLVHGGLGVTGPPIRLGVPPEIVIVTLRAGSVSP